MSVLNLMDPIFNQWLLSLHLLACQKAFVLSRIATCSYLFSTIHWVNLQMPFGRKPHSIERTVARINKLGSQSM